MVATGTEVITTVAGTGRAGFSDDGGAPAAAELHGSYGMAFAGEGNLNVAESWNDRIRKITPNRGEIENGTITTVAGTGAVAFNGDGITASTANLNGLRVLPLTPAGTFISANSVAQGLGGLRNPRA